MASEKDKGESIFNLLIIVSVIIFAFYLIAKAVKGSINEGLNNLHDGIQNGVGNTTFGDFIGVRTTQAEAAGETLMRLPYLKNGFAEQAFEKYAAHFNSGYSIPNYWDTTLANNIAQRVINAHSRVPLANIIPTAFVLEQFLNDSKKAADELLKIQNQVEAAQVTIAYHSDSRTNGKNLSDGIQWLDNADLVRVADHLKSIPTGVYEAGFQLTELTV